MISVIALGLAIAVVVVAGGLILREFRHPEWWD